MSRRPALFTQAHLARAVREAKKAGANAVEISPDGTIRLVLEDKSTSVPVVEYREIVL